MGTRERPFQHRATITLHGTRRAYEIPVYGAKVGAAAGTAASQGTAVSTVVPRLRAAVEQIRRRAREERALGRGRRVHVLVTGSLYLVGDMLRILGRAG